MPGRSGLSPSSTATNDLDKTIVAAAYYAPEPFSNGMWNLYFLATDPLAHGSGAGSALIRTVEGELKAREETVARTLIVDTSSTDDYAQARSFYLRHGFLEEARIRDFYGPGNDKVTFWKSRRDF
ncbi:MAG: GNAT family N-acetyltransferase [Mycobacteriaceae bacterium]|nr:GNAT family N-acetyltransferase [Mycobacteriaceae bacterium]